MIDSLPSLPGRVASRLEELIASLRAGLGDDLVGVLAYGSAVRGGWDEARSDVDLVIVVRDDGATKLEAIGPALELARFSARIEAMILRDEEIARAADVFPLLYDDIAHASACLVGDNPFAGLTVSPAHRRLRVEQELREVRIRMRRVATDAGHGPGFAGAVQRKLKQLRSPLHALLVMHGVGGDDRFEPVIRAAAAHYRVDAAVLLDAVRAPREAFDALARLVDAALADVDAMDDGLVAGAPRSQRAEAQA
jgi:predicted nucleotidyltransferase